MQGTRPCPWSGTPHVEKQLSQWATTAKPMLWSPCSGAHALEPISCNYWSPHALEPMLCNKGMCVLSRVRFFVTPWAVAHQSPLPMESSRQEYQGGLPFPTPGDLPDPGIEPASLTSPVLAGTFFTTALPGRPLQWGVCTLQLESSPHSSQLERAQVQQQRLSTAKNGRWEIWTELTRILSRMARLLERNMYDVLWTHKERRRLENLSKLHGRSATWRMDICMYNWFICCTEENSTTL